jgi:carbon storage regulator
MLVLSRKEGEKLVIGDNITLVVSKICGNRVTVGIEAPADVKIFRGELKELGQVPGLETAKAEGAKVGGPKVVPLRRATLTIDLDELQVSDIEKQAM